MKAAREPPEWFQSALDRLRLVASLEENWDSYGAAAVNRHSVHLAHVLLCHLTKYSGIEKPKISATPSGRVVFSWDDDRHYLDVELDEKGIVTYYYEPADGCEIENSTTTYLELIELLTKYLDRTEERQYWMRIHTTSDINK